MEHRYYGGAEPKCRGRGDQAGGARWCKKASRQKQKTKKPKVRQRKQEAEECKGPRAVTSEERTPGSRILHSKTRGVKFDRTGVVSSKLANRKKVVNHLSNKNIRKTRIRTHDSDRKARPITNLDRRKRGVGVGQKKGYRHQEWCGRRHPSRRSTRC